MSRSTSKDRDSICFSFIVINDEKEKNESQPLRGVSVNNEFTVSFNDMYDLILDIYIAMTYKSKLKNFPNRIPSFEQIISVFDMEILSDPVVI